jgi:hypothetical protein
MKTHTKRIKTILSKKQQTEFLNTNYTLKTLHFKWGKTGMHKCWLYDRVDNVLGSAGGYGYDKKGTAFGEFINTHFNKELKKLNSNDYYGLSHYNTKKTKNRFQKRASKNTITSVDGGCGFHCMVDILNRIGFELKFVKETKWDTFYILTELPKGHRARTKYIYK